MECININEKDNILVVAPHPDDECIGAGGILCKYAKRCTVLLLSMGEQGQGKMSAEKTRNIRRDEFIEEMKKASVKEYYFLNYPDGQLMFHPDMFDDFDLSKYQKIFVTGLNDNHPDHTAAYMSLMKAVENQKVDVEVFSYEVHNPLTTPTHFLDITDVIEQKAELIRFHKSQVGVFPYDEYSMVAANYRGMLLRRPDRLYEVYERTSGNIDKSSSMNEIEMQKFKQFYWVLTRWVELKINGYSIADQLVEYRNVAIYGYAELGKLLVSEIKDSDKKIVYVLDKKQCGIDGVLYPSSQLQKPDCVIVTAITAFDEIKNELEGYGYKNVISLKELVVNNTSDL